MSGTLFVIATPIGNLEDITFRAVATLHAVDYIAAEDTRHTRRLLQKYEIETPVFSFHQRTNPEKVLSHLQKNKSVALVSDAGTPGISDPGAVLISEVVQNGFSVVPIPGPSAVITALSASGVKMHHFEFFGFLPQKKGRQTFYKNLQNLSHTAVFYESSHRIEKCISEMKEFLPKRMVVLGRELTKIHEEFLRGTPEEIEVLFSENPKRVKGEFVVLVEENVEKR